MVLCYCGAASAVVVGWWCGSVVWCFSATQAALHHHCASVNAGVQGASLQVSSFIL